MGRISPANSSNNDMQKNKMGLSGVCGGAFKNNGQIHEMIEEEVDEEEQNEGQDSQDEWIIFSFYHFCDLDLIFKIICPF